ncbi:MAG: AAA family ATPase [Leptolyngbyaceae cyanobacterium]
MLESLRHSSASRACNYPQSLNAHCAGDAQKDRPRAIASGITVVLDVGMATKIARAKFQTLCDSLGCQYRFVFVDAPLAVRSQRVSDRNEQTSRTGDLPVTDEIFAFTNAQFQPPTASEITKLSAQVLINH